MQYLLVRNSINYRKYNIAKKAFDEAKTEYDFKIVSENFYDIKDYKDSESMSELASNKAEEAKEKAAFEEKNKVYSLAISNMEKNTVQSYEEAIKLFETISGFKDSNELQQKCIKKKSRREHIEKYEIFYDALKAIIIIVSVIILIIFAIFLIQNISMKEL